jgi:hypothetical protein
MPLCDFTHLFETLIYYEKLYLQLFFLCILHFDSLGQIQISSGFSYIGEGGWGNKAQYAGSGIDISAKKYLTENLRIGMNWGVYDMRTNLMVQNKVMLYPLCMVEFSNVSYL